MAYVINNVAEEMPFTHADVDALDAAYAKLGFSVHVHEECDTRVSTRT